MTLRSNAALFGLTRIAATAAPDITLSLGEEQGGARAPHREDAVLFRTAPEDAQPDDNLIVRESADGFRFRYADATEFFISRDGRTIRGTWAPASTLADTETYLLGPVLGFAQRVMGLLCLHASAVVIDDCAVALCGPAYSGKSTTAGAFGAAGFAVLADDMTSIRTHGGATMAMPAYDHLRVWEDSERMLLGTAGALPRLTPTWDKRALSLRGHAWTFRDTPAALTAVVLLAPRDDDPARAPRIEPVSSGDAFVSLASNSYANYLLDDAMRAAEFGSIARLMTTARVFRAVPSRDPARLGDLVRAIVGAVRA